MPANKKAILIENYEFVEFSKEKNTDHKVVVAIYGVDIEENLNSGDVIRLVDKSMTEYLLNEYDHDPLVWNGEVYAVFEDFIIVYLY
jgi:hypothetical protein